MGSLKILEALPPMYTVPYVLPKSHEVRRVLNFSIAGEKKSTCRHIATVCWETFEGLIFKNFKNSQAFSKNIFLK